MEGPDSVRNMPEQNEDDARQPTFHCFLRLPYELRVKVWQHFAPQLSTQPLLLQFTLVTCFRRVSEGPSLNGQTQASRAVLATHQESRRLALQALPNSLPIHYLDGEYREGTVHLKLERDIILLDPVFCFVEDHHGCDPSLRVPGFSEHVVNLGMNFAGLERTFQYSGSVSCFPGLYKAFSNVKILWSCGDCDADDIFGFRVPMDPMDAGSSTRPWCDEPSTQEVMLEAVDSLFVNIEPDVADAEVFIPEVKNILIHEEVNRMNYRVMREDGDQGPPEWHDVWGRFFFKGSAFEWFREMMDGNGGDDDEDDSDDTDYEKEKMWSLLVEGKSGEWLKDVELWPLVARYRNRRKRDSV